MVEITNESLNETKLTSKSACLVEIYPENKTEVHRRKEFRFALLEFFSKKL